MVVGIIDIGTNSVLLLIARINPDHSIAVLHDECVIPRLGENLQTTLTFQTAAMARTLTTLKKLQATCQKHHCVEIKAYGTACFRMAKNANIFIERISNELGINVSVIDGKEEARLIYLSCQHDFGHLGNITVLDIGGGSTEIVTAQESASLPFGVVTLTEKFIHSDPPAANEIDQLQYFVRSQLTAHCFDQRPATSDRPPALITTAGTPTTLAAIHLGLKEYDSKSVHGYRLTVNDITKLKDRLETLPLSERAKIPCLPEKRADVVVAGVNALLTVINFLGCDSILISDHGLRYGALHDGIKKSPSP